jgi:hypothetical protein
MLEKCYNYSECLTLETVLKKLDKYEDLTVVLTDEDERILLYDEGLSDKDISKIINLLDNNDILIDFDYEDLDDDNDIF